jgi:pimeloyl-ACP methyl ester carboxylesterase
VTARRCSRLLGAIVVSVVGTGTVGCSGSGGSDGSRSATVTYADRRCPVDVSAALVGAATCGTLTVPENRETGTGKVRLLVATLTPPRLRHADPIVVVGTDLGASPNYAGIGPLAQHTGRRIVFLEQRGTAHSRPLLSCPPPPAGSESDDGTARTGTRSWRQKIARVESACFRTLRSNGIDVASYDVSEMAADVADLIRSLHLAPANVITYGSTSLIALELMRIDSVALRSVVMDTPMVPGVDPRVRAASSTAHAVSRVLRWCAEDRACRRRHADPATLMSRALRSLAVRPLSLLVDTSDGPAPVTLDSGLLVRVARQAMTDGGSAGRWGLPQAVPALLEAVARRDETIAASALAELLGAQGPLCPGYRDKCMSAHVVAEGVWNTVLCRDMATARTATGATRRSGPGYAAAYDRGWWWDVCRVWKVPPGPGPSPEIVVSDVPTLVTVGGLAGPASLTAVRHATEGLSRASIVRVPTGSHNVLGMTCLSGLRDSWLDTLDSTSRTPSCVRTRLRWGS